MDNEDTGHLEVYRVDKHNLVRASNAMNFSESSLPGRIFRSKVEEIIVEDKTCLVIVRIWGSYPYITDPWKEFIIEEVEV